MNPGGDSELWARRLHQEFRLLRKTPHGFATAARHPTVRQEWIVRINRHPYDRWVEVDPESVEERSILAGRGLSLDNGLNWCSWAALRTVCSTPLNRTGNSQRNMGDDHGRANPRSPRIRASPVGIHRVLGRNGHAVRRLRQALRGWGDHRPRLSAYPNNW
jgi:hypothetical protein